MSSPNTASRNSAPIDASATNDSASTRTSPLQPPHATVTVLPQLAPKVSTPPDNNPTVCDGATATLSEQSDDDNVDFIRAERILIGLMQTEQAMEPLCHRLYHLLQERTRALKRVQLIEQALKKQNEAICLRCQKKSDAVMKVHAAVMDLQTVSSPRSA